MGLQPKLQRWLCLVMYIFFGIAVQIKAGPGEDLIDRLPGQPKVNFKQYAGYITVDDHAGRALFYYFAEAEDDSDSKPVTLWSNGGPGCSSLGGGAFTELGPFYPQGNGRGLRKNLQSWNKASNVLFVESPAGVGWSYSNTTADYTCGDGSTAKNMLVFLSRWFKRFPEYASRDLFLTGESYAGHYIPQLASKLLKYNKVAKRYKFNLKGIAIGNPLLSLNVDTIASYEFLWSHGLISDESNIAIRKSCNFDKRIKNVDVIDISKDCDDILKQVEQEVGDYVNEYDVILDVCPPSLIEQELRLRKKVSHISLGVDVCMTSERSFYFNLPQVQKALHANRTNLPYEWSMCSDVLNYSSYDEGIDILPVLKGIIQEGIRVWIFSGDQDSVVPLMGSRTNVRHLATDLKLSVRVPYRAWYHQGQVAGWTTVYGDLLTFATVRGASHMVPYSQPARALHLFKAFLSGKDLPDQQ